MQKTLLVIMGPTASGKTRLAIDLAKAYHAEIISADSRQFYRQMDIGTAKPNAIELAEAKHHFIDIRDPHEYYSAGDFEKEALLKLEELFDYNDVAIAVGGSGLYLKALCEGLDDMPPVDEPLREKLIRGFSENGLEWLQVQYRLATHGILGNIDLNNPQRLMRAIEKMNQGVQAKGVKKERPFQILKFAIHHERETLYQRINNRVDAMVLEGLEAEAKCLYPHRNTNALKTVGYTELFDYFDGTTSKERAIVLIKQHSRNYAKRQLTWCKADEEIHWLNPSVGKSLLSQVSEFYNP